MRDQKTRLYEVDVDGTVFWISAYDPIHAYTLADGCDAFADIVPDSGIAIEPCPDKRAQNSTFHSDDYEDGEDPRSLYDEWQRDTSPRVVACSEW